MAASSLLLCACSDGTAPERTPNGAVEANGAAFGGNVALPADAAPKLPAPVSYTLAGDGLSPDIKFGMKQAEAIAAATKSFGAPGKLEHNGECGEGPMDFVRFHDLQLGFQEGKFAGWSLGSRTPALKTASGIGIGTPRSALGKIEIDEQSSLGPEFAVGEIGGVLGDDGKVAAL